MEQIISVVQANFYPIIGISVVTVASLIFSFSYMMRMKAQGNEFLKEHPDAAKVYLTVKALITSEVVTVHTVDGRSPFRFAEGGKSGFYLTPGQTEVQISYSYTRPGVLHKNVTTSTGVVDKVLEVEANKKYLLGFNRKEKQFTFESFAG
ncbi:MAG: hypothetical protein LBU32_24975 [Clostridiales bacterium]|jgi:hypothetical protein|nr:hypothetical protein [Clostridiales bacterium]